MLSYLSSFLYSSKPESSESNNQQFKQLTEVKVDNESSPVTESDKKVPTPEDTKVSNEQKPVNRIIVLLDESGSMGIHRQEITEAVNTFINEQKKVTNDNCKFSLFTFDHKFKIIINDSLMSTSQNIDISNYQPLGCTALYDAIGKSINMYKTEKNVILVIVTDGWENASRDYTKRKVSEMIAEYKDPEKYGWNIIYLASDPFLIRQGCDLNIDNNPSKGSCNCAINFAEFAIFTKNLLCDAITKYRTGITNSISLKSDKDK